MIAPIFPRLALCVVLVHGLTAAERVLAIGNVESSNDLVLQVAADSNGALDSVDVALERVLALDRPVIGNGTSNQIPAATAAWRTIAYRLNLAVLRSQQVSSRTVVWDIQVGIYKEISVQANAVYSKLRSLCSTSRNSEGRIIDASATISALPAAAVRAVEQFFEVVFALALNEDFTEVPPISELVEAVVCLLEVCQRLGRDSLLCHDEWKILQVRMATRTLRCLRDLEKQSDHNSIVRSRLKSGFQRFAVSLLGSFGSSKSADDGSLVPDLLAILPAIDAAQACLLRSNASSAELLGALQRLVVKTVDSPDAYSAEVPRMECFTLRSFVMHYETNHSERVMEMMRSRSALQTALQMKLHLSTNPKNPCVGPAATIAGGDTDESRSVGLPPKASVLQDLLTLRLHELGSCRFVNAHHPFLFPPDAPLFRGLSVHRGQSVASFGHTIVDLLVSGPGSRADLSRCELTQQLSSQLGRTFFTSSLLTALNPDM